MTRGAGMAVRVLGLVRRGESGWGSLTGAGVPRRRRLPTLLHDDDRRAARLGQPFDGILP
jgi:hypothetical protein